MAHRLRYVALIGAGVALAVSCVGREASTGKAGAATPDFRPDATMREIMDSLVDPSADGIWDAVATTITAKGTIEKYPRTDEEWQELRRHAIRLMEATNLLLIPGRHVAKPGEKAVDPAHELDPDRVEAIIDGDRAAFAQFAHLLHDSVGPVIKAIDAKDKDALLAAGDGIDAACETCHLRYWYPSAPSNGRK